MLVENLSTKPAEFYLKGIDNQPVKWQVWIQNNGEYTIGENVFIVYLSMNKL